MKLGQVVSTSALSLLLTTTALVYAQEQSEEPKPAPETRPEATQPAPQGEMKPERQEEAKPDKQNEEKKGENKATKEEKKQDEKNTKQEMKSGDQAGRNMQSGQSGSERHSVHIPDNKFHSNFGRGHKFTVRRTTVQGQPGFVYGGYSFILVDAWPADWGFGDDCYVDYVDGEYFLFDLLHPGIQVALVVVG